MLKHLLLGAAAAACLAACESDQTTRDQEYQRDHTTTYRDYEPTYREYERNRPDEPRNDIRGADVRPADENLFGGPSPAQTDRTYPTTRDQQYRDQQYQQRGAVSGTDAQFLRDAANINNAEIEMGRLASQRAANDDVRRFGDTLVQHHTQALNEEQSIARQKGIDLPSDLDQRHRQMADNLSRMRDNEFDREFIDMMIQGHRDAITRFEEATRTATDPQVRTWASNTLPVLRDHLRMAQDLQRQIGTGMVPGMNRDMRDTGDRYRNNQP